MKRQHPAVREPTGCETPETHPAQWKRRAGATNVDIKNSIMFPSASSETSG